MRICGYPKYRKNLEQIKQISDTSEYTKNLLHNTNTLIGDFESLVAISDYFNAKINDDQYVQCQYRISQNGDDLLDDSNTTEKFLKPTQWENIFFASVQENLSRLKKES